jgi:hypothetical protein
MLYSLVRARRAGRILHREQAQRFIFPALSNEGHLVDWREHREVLSKFGTDLRQSLDPVSYCPLVDEVNRRVGLAGLSP